jgi:AraC-like DNA-binding protein
MERCPHCAQAIIRPRAAAEPFTGKRALLALAGDLEGCPAGMWRFFEVVFDDRQRACRSYQVATALGVAPSTLLSLFWRARLPAPKQYLLWASFLRAAARYEQPDTDTLDGVVAAGYSSPQAFGRSARVFLGITLGEFRREWPSERSFDRFRAELVLPHVHTLRVVDPLAHRERRTVAA